MTSLLALLGNRNAIVSLLVFAVLAVLGVQNVRLSHAKHDLAQAKLALRDPETLRTWEAEARASLADLERCRARATALADAIAAQNQALRSLKFESDRRLAASERDLAAARGSVRTAKADALRILQARPDLDTCQSALDLLRRGSH